MKILQLALVSMMCAAADRGTNIRLAEPGDISTDRPGFTSTTDTVLPGYAQIEGGVLLTRHAFEVERSTIFPSPLVRIGLTRIAEIRLAGDGYVLGSSANDGGRLRQNGFSDIEVGLKVRLRDERGYTPQLALIAGVTLPTGSHLLSSGATNPFLDLCWSTSLPNGWNTAGTVHFEWQTHEGSNERGLSLTIGRKLGSGFGAFAEVYRLSPIENDERAHWIADAGITRLLGPNMQIDVSAGHTIGAHTPCWYASAGFAIRFEMPGMVKKISERARNWMKD